MDNHRASHSFSVPLPYTLIILILTEPHAGLSSTDSKRKKNAKVSAKRIFPGTAKKESTNPDRQLTQFKQSSPHSHARGPSYRPRTEGLSDILPTTAIGPTLETWRFLTR